MITVTYTYACGGCDEKEINTSGRVTRTFSSFSGRSHGFGTYSVEQPSAIDLAPEGWVPFDPYTQCCYCPKCWAEIEAVPIHEAETP